MSDAGLMLYQQMKPVKKYNSLSQVLRPRHNTVEIMCAVIISSFVHVPAGIVRLERHKLN